MFFARVVPGISNNHYIHYWWSCYGVYYRYRQTDKGTALSQQLVLFPELNRGVTESVHLGEDGVSCFIQHHCTKCQTQKQQMNSKCKVYFCLHCCDCGHSLVSVDVCDSPVRPCCCCSCHCCPLGWFFLLWK